MPTSTIDCYRCHAVTEPFGTARIAGAQRHICEDCFEHLYNERAERRAKLHRERWARLAQALPRAENWSLESFPAHDAVGRKALEQARWWLATAYGVVTNADGTHLKYDLDLANEDAFYETWQEISPDHVDDADYRTSAYLHGPIGSGKTGLAWSMLRLVHENTTNDDGETVLRFANVVSLIRQAKRAMSDEDTEDPFPSLMTADLLVLDDLGAERVTSWARSAILELVQHRYDHQRPTIVTSNYAPSALAKRLGQSTRDEPTAEPLIGQRIVSRLIDGAVKIHLNRADLRMRNDAATVADLDERRARREAGS